MRELIETHRAQWREVGDDVADNSGCRMHHLTVLVRLQEQLEDGQAKAGVYDVGTQSRHGTAQSSRALAGSVPHPDVTI